MNFLLGESGKSGPDVVLPLFRRNKGSSTTGMHFLDKTPFFSMTTTLVSEIGHNLACLSELHQNSKNPNSCDDNQGRRLSFYDSCDDNQYP